MLIREGRSSDLEALTDLYNHYIVTTYATFDLAPFTYDQRRVQWFDHYGTSGRHRLLVAEDEGRIVGYTTSSPFRAKAAYDTSVETTIYLAPDAPQGRGIGTALYTALFDALQDEDVHRAYAGVALPNEASVALHRRFGFEPVGTFTEVGYKFGQYWDVAWFGKPL